jgi:perosamine synthetase
MSQHVPSQISDKFLYAHPDDMKGLVDALAGRQLSGTSDLVSAYEVALANYFETEYAVALSSGSAALHTALYLLGATNGAEVLVPATAPIPSLLPILTAGALPVFVDSAETNLGFDLEDLQRKITPRTKAAMVVPMWGYPFSLQETLLILNQADIPLIEDIAQAHGTVIDGCKAESWGTIGCFSTHDRKLLATGEGGGLLTNDAELAERGRQFAQLGGMDGETYGVNYKLSTLQCALGMARIPYIEENLHHRQANAFHLRAALDGCSNLQELSYPQLCTPNYYYFVIQSTTPAEMRLFIEALRMQGIPSDITRYRYRVAYEYPLFQAFCQERCPQAEKLVKQITTVPVHPGLSEQELKLIAEAIREEQQLLTRGV